jgi:hypothetical protein
LPSVYAAGNELPIFTVGDLTFGIFICYESNYYYSPRYSAGFQLRRLDGEPANFFFNHQSKLLTIRTLLCSISL